MRKCYFFDRIETFEKLSNLLRLGNCNDDEDEDYNGDNGEGWPGVGPLTIGGIPRMASSYYEVLPTSGYLLSLLMRKIIDQWQC